MFELILNCSEQNNELLSDALLDLGALSVSLEDANAYTAQEQEIFAEPGMEPGQTWQHAKLTALFEDQAKVAAAWQQISQQEDFGLINLVAIQPVESQDWVRLTQSQFSPVEVVEGFWIVPSWSQAPPQAKQIIELDPGLAFGTGTHPTTKMCLSWLSQHVKQQPRVLDYGCGSGILAIAAAKFGAATVDAVDIDEVAVQTAQDNAVKNQVSIHTGLPDMATGKYDIVVANILASPLKVLAPLLTKHLKDNGQLVLSGILQRQEQELIAAYAPYIKLQVSAQEDGWILMTAANEVTEI